MANRSNVLRVLADVLEEKELKDNVRRGFNMNSFISTPDPDSIKGDEFTLAAGQSPTMCGTSLCVGGFAALEAGWKFKFAKSNDGYGNYVRLTYIDPKDEAAGFPGFDVVGREYLGISGHIADKLFYALFDGGATSIKILEHLAFDVNADEESVDLVYGKGCWAHERAMGYTLRYNEDGTPLYPYVPIEDDEDDEDAEGPRCTICGDYHEG
jgi:hypothetical protein